jgi:hypothetical protein
MSEPHWHKWLSGDEWAKMGPFPDEQACPYCRTEKAEARAKAWEEDALLRAKNEVFWRDRSEQAEARVKELEEELNEVRKMIAVAVSCLLPPTECGDLKAARAAEGER